MNNQQMQRNNFTKTTYSFRSNKKFLPYGNKTQATTPTQWAKGTPLIAGASMLQGIDENRLSKTNPNSIKIRIFWGATIDDIKDFLESVNLILHVCTNISINNSSSAILNKLLSLTNLINTLLPKSNVIFSNKTDRLGNGIAGLKISNFNKHLNSLKIDTIDNGNILSEYLKGSNLHLNRHGMGKLAMNLIEKVGELPRKTFNRNWQQSRQFLALLQYYVSNCVCNNDCKRVGYGRS